MTVNLGAKLAILIIGLPAWYVPNPEFRQTWWKRTMHALPGTARSRCLAFKRLGETYCRSRVVSWGSCFSTFRKTYDSRLVSESTSRSLEIYCALHNRYPRPYPILSCRHRHDNGGKPPVRHVILFRTLGQRRSRGRLLGPALRLWVYKYKL